MATLTIKRAGLTHWQPIVDLVKEVGGRHREVAVKLAGGGETHVYLDVKGVLDRRSRLNLAADAMLEWLEAQSAVISGGTHEFLRSITAIGGPTMGADVLAHVMVARADAEDWKWFSVRDTAKTDHGLGRWIEGAELGPDDKVILTDDVASTGKSLRESYERIIETGAQVLAVIPLVERGRSAGAYFEDLGVPYLPVIDYTELGLEALG